MINATLADLFDELAELTKLEDQNPQSFRARAYESASRSLRELQPDITGLTKSEMIGLKGIGKSTADKIAEFLDRGSIDKLDRLRAMFPTDFRQMVKIPGLGAKTAAKLRDELGVDSVEKLAAAIADEKLRDVAGLGAKTEEKLAKAIGRLGMSGKDRRTPIAEAMPVAERVAKELSSVEGVVEVKICGSLRRLRDTVADVDILVASSTPQPVANRVRDLPVVDEIIADGDTKVSFLTHAGLQIDVRVIAPESFGAAIMYFTGSKAHNIALRQRAIARGMTLNEYALADAEDGHVVAALSETDIYAALDLAHVVPRLREDSGEIEAAAGGQIPVVTLDMIRGDLHVHSDLSGDGEDSLVDMIEGCVARGYEYMAITDHAEDLTINGASRQQMVDQRGRLRELASRYPTIELLHGTELNIDPDGNVDYDAEFLSGFDYAVASVHSHFDLPEQRQTIRLLTAMGNPAVRAIGHLSGRMIGRRPGIEFDVDAILEGAETTGVALEINSHLERLDATSEVIRKARGRDVTFIIDTDAHRVRELDYMRWGVQQAQRGWLDPDQCANTWPVDTFLKFCTKET